MKNKTTLITATITLIIMLFASPFALIYSVKELFQIDWANNYWGVFWIMYAVSCCFKSIKF